MLGEIGDNLRRVELFRRTYSTDHMHCVVSSLYVEIVNFLMSVIKFWKKRRLGRYFNSFIGRKRLVPLQRQISRSCGCLFDISMHP